MTDNISGLVLLHKEAGMTSQVAVLRVRRLFDGIKAGHTGTLDPMATGVLPVLIGRGVKGSEFLLEGCKHYRAVLRLGIETDTEDVTGTVLRTCPDRPDEAAVRRTAASFLGDGMQIPPMYSAIRVGGRRLMELARRGETVERQARPIRIDALTVTPRGDGDYDLDVRCSKGTYIRTLCADIGRALGCGGCMAALCRMEAAGFPLDACRTLAEWEALSYDARREAVIPVERLFENYAGLALSPFFSHLGRNGLPLYLHKLGIHAALGTRYRLSDEAGFFALGEVVEAEEGLAVKPIRQF